jgi:hypothetical protein
VTLHVMFAEHPFGARTCALPCAACGALNVPETEFEPGALANVCWGPEVEIGNGPGNEKKMKVQKLP